MRLDPGSMVIQILAEPQEGTLFAFASWTCHKNEPLKRRCKAERVEQTNYCPI
ncbi:hypothetical protein CY34DRAFT_812842, partial [Suillus luteus UH-Slu-Lm8-n1]